MDWLGDAMTPDPKGQTRRVLLAIYQLRSEAQMVTHR